MILSYQLNEQRERRNSVDLSKRYSYDIALKTAFKTVVKEKKNVRM